MAFHVVDIHFAANGRTSEVDEFITRTFKDEPFEAQDCYDYASNKCGIGHDDIAGVIYTVWSNDWETSHVVSVCGTYVTDKFDALDFV